MSDPHLKTLEEVLGKDRVHRDIDISEFLNTKLGAKVDAYYIATNLNELKEVVGLCWDLSINFLVIGTGSKVALSLQGFSGLVIKNAASNLKIAGIKGKISPKGLGVEEALLEAQSGATLSALAKFSIQQKLTGLETFGNIPGSVGGSIFYMPQLQAKCQTIKILEKIGESEISPVELKRDDLILSAIFKLKAAPN